MTSYRRQVGEVRPSHLMYTSGVGALIDLPRLSVLVRGLDDWDYSAVPADAALSEDRLLAAVQRELGAAGGRVQAATVAGASRQPGPGQ